MSPQELADQFLKESAQFRLGGLTTETPHPLTKNLSALSLTQPSEALKLFARVEAEAISKMRPYAKQIEAMAADMKQTLQGGGRIFFGGCGATGRLALTLEWVWPESGNVFGFMAGGDYALVRSIESFEDHPEYGARQLEDLGFKSGDLFVGVTEGGETPFVIGATLRAAEISPNKSYFLFCNPITQLTPFERCQKVLSHSAIHKMSFEIGPMALCGSTRLQATSCLMLAAGSALLSVHDGKSFTTRLNEVLLTLTETDFSRATDVMLEEFSAYQRGETFTHASHTHALSVSTDVTERSPTFSLFPLENDLRGDNWKSWAYPNVPDTKTSAEAWKKLLWRDPRPLPWPGFEDYGMRTVLGFDFSKVRSENTFSLEADPKEVIIKANDKSVIFKSHPDPLVECLLVKALLNAISTVGMGRLGRYEGNLMLWVRASNYKLIDRASRYISHLLERRGQTESYEKIVRTLFECQKDLGQGEPIVMKTVNQLVASKGSALMQAILVLMLVFSASTSFGWGRRGHSIIGTNAAYILSDEKADDFYLSHSYDVGYYTNTPDFFWKEPATYDREHFQHYMNKEIFDRGLKDYKGPDPFALSREEFDSKFPQVPLSAGRSWWRIRELNDLLSATTKKLSDANLTKDVRFQNQGTWLMLAGVIGHYVGDLAQPLHDTENYNGQLTNQSGVHHFFEEDVVDEMYGPLEQKTSQEARKRWKFFHKKNSDKPLLTLLKDMTNAAYSDLPELLKIDKRIGHTNAKKAVASYRGMIEERITVASLYLAEILVRQTNFQPDNDKFFVFIGRPDYIEPGKTGTVATLATDDKSSSSPADSDKK